MVDSLVKITIPSEVWADLRDEKIRSISVPEKKKDFYPGQLVTLIKEGAPMQQIHLDLKSVGYDLFSDHIILTFPESSYHKKEG